MKISKQIFLLHPRRLLHIVSYSRDQGHSVHSARNRLYCFSVSAKMGNSQSGVCPDSPAMERSPHPSTAEGAGNMHINSPATPPSSLIQKFSSVSPTSPERVELLHHIAASPTRDSLAKPLTRKQVAHCKETLSQLLKKFKSHVIDREFDVLRSERLQATKLLACTTVGRMESNLPKNRYLDIIPYDDTRVILEENRNGQSSSYINASYVRDPSYGPLPKFIATQGPLPHTNADFWEMVVQQQCPVIVMLTGLVDRNDEMVKCDNYFPSQSNESLTYGRFRITNKETTTSQNSVIYRLLEIETLQSGDSAPIPVLHMQLEWPDYGIPSSTESVREMVRTNYRIPSNFGPFVVHCSAGIGRTGTYCTIDHTLRRILLGDRKAADMMRTVRCFRQQRLGMVQTREQYAFCYAAVIEELQNLLG